jgi:hypothetical protein
VHNLPVAFLFNLLAYGLMKRAKYLLQVTARIVLPATGFILWPVFLLSKELFNGL